MSKLIGPFEWEGRLRWAYQEDNGDIYYHEGGTVERNRWEWHYDKRQDRTFHRSHERYRVMVEPSPFPKCRRCYCRKEENGVRSDGGVLCERCAKVLGLE